MASTELIYLAISAIAATLLLGAFARLLKFAVKLILLIALTVGVYMLLSSPEIRTEVDKAIQKTKKVVEIKKTELVSTRPFQFC